MNGDAAAGVPQSTSANGENMKKSNASGGAGGSTNSIEGGAASADPLDIIIEKLLR